MKTIYKYQLRITDNQYVDTYEGATPLFVDVQDGKLCLWVKVDTERNEYQMQIQVVGTGNSINGNALKYIGSVQMPPFAWHIFQV